LFYRLFDIEKQLLGWRGVEIGILRRQVSAKMPHESGTQTVCDARAIFCCLLNTLYAKSPRGVRLLRRAVRYSGYCRHAVRIMPDPTTALAFGARGDVV
jgi:hypothetical protein